jgi:hypothetical protein
MPRTVLTPPAGGAPMPDIPNWAWHEYGNRVGFWRMLEGFDRNRIRAVLAINGSAIGRYEPIARAARDRGMRMHVDQPGQYEAIFSIDHPVCGARIIPSDKGDGSIDKGDVDTAAIDVALCLLVPGDNPVAVCDDGRGRSRCTGAAA